MLTLLPWLLYLVGKSHRLSIESITDFRRRSWAWLIISRPLNRRPSVEFDDGRNWIFIVFIHRSDNCTKIVFPKRSASHRLLSMREDNSLTPLRAVPRRSAARSSRPTKRTSSRYSRRRASPLSRNPICCGRRSAPDPSRRP